MSTDEDIATFVQARLDEVEARVHNDIEWWFDECAISATMHGGNTVAGADDYIRPFIDPARVLRGVEAKRRLLARYERAVWAGDSHPSTYARGQDDGYRQACLDAIRDECSVYADHPDFRPEWTL